MKMTEFLLQLEEDEQLRRRYKNGNRGQRKKLAKDQGLTDEQADAVSTDEPRELRAALEQEDASATFVFVVM